MDPRKPRGRYDCHRRAMACRDARSGCHRAAASLSVPALDSSAARSDRRRILDYCRVVESASQESESSDSTSVGDQFPQGFGVIEVRLGELRQLFNSIDPSPFRERDLDPRAEQFIVEWGSDFPPHVHLALVVHLDGATRAVGEAVDLRNAVGEYFGTRALASRRRLRELFRRGRISLAIALAFLTASIAVGDALASYLREGRFAEVVREGFLIGGWVAMWRPLELFLYDWWPIRAEARLFERLSKMPVKIVYEQNPSRAPGADPRGTPARPNQS